MIPKVIKNEADYHEALACIAGLMDARPGTADGDQLELLSTLVELYEKEQFPMDAPDPVTAIRFRMEQQGLTQRDLARFIGSPGRVSDILNGRRPLSLAMIRSLHKGLGIPADILLQKPGGALPPENPDLEWRKFPIAVMVQRGWFAGFSGTPAQARARAEELVSAFADGVITPAEAPLFRQHVRSRGKMDAHALQAWCIRIKRLALQRKSASYKPGTVTKGMLRELAILSAFDSGPVLAQEYLAKKGIRLAIEAQLPRTHLDGAMMLLPDGAPVIGLTLRYDRLDHYWFTLFHELMHLAKHVVRRDATEFVDDLEDKGGDSVETEADAAAAEALIPAVEWTRIAARVTPTPQAVEEAAARLRIHPAIVAGRIRRESGNYRILSRLVGYGAVRRLFGMTP